MDTAFKPVLKFSVPKGKNLFKVRNKNTREQTLSY